MIEIIKCDINPAVFTKGSFWAKINEFYANKEWGIEDRLEYLIAGYYDKRDAGLYVPKSIDTIPAGLKGVKIFYVYQYAFPKFIAPDFNGIIKYNIDNTKMPKEWVKIAKDNYLENEKLARSARFNRLTDTWTVLPENMPFFE